MKQARRSVQGLLGSAHDHEIVFTSGESEANNTKFLSALATQERRDEVVTSVEHSAILALVEQFGDNDG